MEKTFTIALEYDNAHSELGSEAPKLYDGDAEKQELSVSIRKISNGYLVCKSWYEGDCDNRCYKNEEVYYKDNPLANA